MLTLPSWVSSGDHDLTATVYDEVDNAADDTVRIDVTASGDITTFHITNPFDNQKIERTSSTYNIIIEVPDADDITYLEVAVRNLWTGETSVAGFSSSPSSITSISWTLPDPARYSLTARASGADGITQETSPIEVRVTGSSPILPPLSELFE